MLRPCKFTAYSLGLNGSEMTPDEIEFLLAMHEYQKQFHRRYPTWREVLHVARCLGYRKTETPPPNPLPEAERGTRLPLPSEGRGSGG